MTDCFIMIHVIIFFVGVTDAERGALCGRRLPGLVSKEAQRGTVLPGGV